MKPDRKYRYHWIKLILLTNGQSQTPDAEQRLSYREVK